MKQKRNSLALSLPFLSIIIIISSSIIHAAQVPKAEKEIQIYSGAVRDVKEESKKKEEMGWENDPNLRSAILKIYKTKSSPEDVFAFYLQAFGGKEGVSDEDPMRIKPGSVSEVKYEIEFYTNDEFKDYFIEEGSKHHGTWMKQNLIKNRKPHKAGKWIKEARFEWSRKEVNNNFTQFYLIIFDNSFESAPDKYKTDTQIEVQVTTSKSEESMREEADEDMDRETQKMSKSLKNKPPSEKDLGVPLYPGAKFDAENSAGMSAGNDYAIYIYLSNDPPSKVAAFYEKQLKKKPASMEKDQYMIPIKGKMPMPDEGISIQPNTLFGGKSKTVISIQKMVKGRE